NTDVRAYALTVARQVARLRAAGVPSDHITVTGMSKGGVITVLTTATIADPNVRFVVFAGCPPSWDYGIRTGVQAPGRAQGRVLSMYDRYNSDVSSCSRYVQTSPGLTFTALHDDWRPSGLAAGGQVQLHGLSVVEGQGVQGGESLDRHPLYG